MMVLLDQASVEGLLAAVNGTMLGVAIAGTLATLGLLIWSLRTASAERARERPRQDQAERLIFGSPRSARGARSCRGCARRHAQPARPAAGDPGGDHGVDRCERRPDPGLGPGGELGRHGRRSRRANAVATARLHGQRGRDPSASFGRQRLRPRRKSWRSGSRRRLPLRSRTPASTPSFSIRQSRTT